MKRRVIRIVLTGAVVVAAVALVWPRGEREPVYQGKKLSWWMRSGSQAIGGFSAEHIRAIRQIGTNALPYYMKWISYEPSKPKQKALAVAGKVPSWLGGQLLCDFVYDDQGNWAGAQFGFYVLGSDAAPVATELAALMRHKNAEIRLRAITCLEYIGQPGIPALVAGLNDQQYPDRARAAFWLIKAYLESADTNSCIAVVRRCVHDSDPEVVQEAIYYLSRGDVVRKGIFSDFAVPALTELIGHPNCFVRYYAVSGLHGYRHDALPAVGALTGALTDTDETVRRAATNALAKIAPEVLENAGAGGGRN